MRPHVASKVFGLREGFATRLADMRLLPRMGPHVNPQFAGIVECLFARLALDFFLLNKWRVWHFRVDLYVLTYQYQGIHCILLSFLTMRVFKPLLEPFYYTLHYTLGAILLQN